MSVSGPDLENLKLRRAKEPKPKRQRRAEKMAAPKPKAPARRRRRPADPAWKPGHSRGSSAGGHGSIAALNGIALPETDEAIILSDRSTSYDTAVTTRAPEIASLSSPLKGAFSTCVHRVVDGAIRVLHLAHAVKTHLGSFGIYVPEDSTHHAREAIPEFPDDLNEKIDGLGLPESNTEKYFSIVDRPISLSSLSAIERLKQGRSQARVPSNAQVTNQVSANAVAKVLGFESEDWQWLHLLGHALFGDAAQIFENLVLGRAGPNAVMNDIAESLVKHVLTQKDAPDEVYLSAHVRYVEGAESAKLADKITWVLKDKPGDDYTKIVKYNFDPLATTKLSETLIEEFKKLLPKLFNQGPDAVVLETPTKPDVPKDALTPTPDKPTSRTPLSPATLAQNAGFQTPPSKTGRGGSHHRRGAKPPPLVFSPARSTGFSDAEAPSNRPNSQVPSSGGENEVSFPDIDLDTGSKPGNRPQ